MTNFGDAERHIASLLSVGNEFTINGKTYVIKWSGKPTCKKGEPKTDIYVYAESDKDSIEVKTSYKKSNADFIENKTTADRESLGRLLTRDVHRIHGWGGVFEGDVYEFYAENAGSHQGF